MNSMNPRILPYVIFLGLKWIRDNSMNLLFQSSEKKDGSDEGERTPPETAESPPPQPQQPPPPTKFIDAPIPKVFINQYYLIIIIV